VQGWHYHDQCNGSNSKGVKRNILGQHGNPLFLIFALGYLFFGLFIIDISFGMRAYFACRFSLPTCFISTVPGARAGLFQGTSLF
jgi:hypothetical protein